MSSPFPKQDTNNLQLQTDYTSAFYVRFDNIGKLDRQQILDLAEKIDGFSVDLIEQSATTTSTTAIVTGPMLHSKIQDCCVSLASLGQPWRRPVLYACAFHRINKHMLMNFAL